MNVTVTLLALLIEAAVGYPDRITRAIGHPVMWMGYMIDWLDCKFNRPDRSAAYRKTSGFMAAFCIVAVPAALGFGVQRGLLLLPLGIVMAGTLASTLLAQRSLHVHVARVADALEREGLSGGRQAVSQIVGRDPDTLDAAGVSRAAIESLAENFSDGIVAPVFWLTLGGLAGGAAYKAINTADSMIGHRTPRYGDFGFAAARLDDLVNLPASRLSALLIIAAAAISKNASASQAWRAVRRDAHHHRSPNAGYPEAAMAGALGLALAGPRVYGGVMVEDAAMGNGRSDAGPTDIRAALALYRRADLIFIVLVAVLAAVVIAPM
ncbi:adenosylcobinamide-phosphate synthase CbiB [Phreatobacter oligotrophus]|jgi:adenosylcobinamide-phosphate synthase|uniref:Cobalamin biosynthesis protein CobD n=1 Tax=Phreatobacter oligotrophus TaxID=1122261 RepID=A0A2T4YWN3_9HYPH|nr:adenosylcobinamide-phosphate synthase CbiB [Phreatobacter oligotrophus]PTM49081.1 adenosylcobinamide-phosphate synthase [Phreatobacter oligotrophus]